MLTSWGWEGRDDAVATARNTDGAGDRGDRAPAAADFLTISPSGTSGTGGTITFAEIRQDDLSSANVNTDFTASGTIPIMFTIPDKSPVSIYGNDVGGPASHFSSLLRASA